MCNETACTRIPLVSRIRAVNSSVGTAAYGSALASMMSIASSDTAALRLDAPSPIPQPGKELGHLLVRLPPTLEPPPQTADVSDQLVAGVDRHDETLGSDVRGPQQHRRDVSEHGVDDRIRGNDVGPRVERQQA